MNGEFKTPLLAGIIALAATILVIVVENECDVTNLVIYAGGIFVASITAGSVYCIQRLEESRHKTKEHNGKTNS